MQLRIRFRGADRTRDLVVTTTDPDATVADLVAALDPGRPAGPVEVDGRLVIPSTPLDRAGIGDGAELAPAGALTGATSPAQTPPLIGLVVTAGLDAGRFTVLATGEHRVGRPASGGPPSATDVPLADPTVSAVHATLRVAADGTVEVTDRGSTNGTQVDGRRATDRVLLPLGSSMRCGAAVIERVAPTTDVLPAPALGSTTCPWRRGPRPCPIPDPPLLTVPTTSDPATSTPTAGAVAVLGSAVAAGVLVVATGSWTAAVFALLGPILLLANVVDGRLRGRLTRRRTARRRRLELAQLEAELGRRQDLERLRSERVLVGVHRATRWVAEGSPSCWSRRPDDDDAFTVQVGVGAVPWSVPFAGDPDTWCLDVAEVAERHAAVSEAPVGLDLVPGRPVAVVGPGPARLALARAVVIQAAVAHGPADLALAVLAAPDRAPCWDWAAWLPHSRHAGTGHLLAGHGAAATAVVGALTEEPAGRRRRTLVVIDDPVQLAARRGPVRSVLRLAADPASELVPIVLVVRASEVPATCRSVLSIAADGRLTAPPGSVLGPAVATGTSADVARETARRLARFDDPDLAETGADLPATVPLLDLLGPAVCDPAVVAARWVGAGTDPAPRAVLGLSGDGPLEVDLATDGPHALVAGTTGSGKSELLRTLVASLAVSSSPDHLTFVLIDFKGGSAFDACAGLPHVTGVVTDLDEHLASRALRCLEAELRHREQRLREAGAADLADLRQRAGSDEPLPRLVVVVDEFATLAAELPDFVVSLVGIAQRGRSLGVHLVLATQRPSGSVSEQIRANTSLRIALRTGSAGDSSDVIDAPDAADLPRRRPGRALVRLGPGELQVAQTALVSATTGDRGPADTGVRRHEADRPITVRPLGLARGPEVDPSNHAGSANRPDGPSDLDRLVGSMVTAWTERRGAPPRRPWPDPLPTDLPWPVVGDAPTLPGDRSDHLVIGLEDDPDHQRQRPFTWAPEAGALLLVGSTGSGATTAAATVVLEAVRRWGPHGVDVHVIDLGGGRLAVLEALPEVGAVIGADELERQRRLLDEVARDLAARRAARSSRPAPHGASAPRIDDTHHGPTRLLVIDGLGGFRARWDEHDPTGPWSQLVDLIHGGTEVGLHVVVAAEGAGSVPHRLVAACPQRVVLRLGDPHDHGALGVTGPIPDLPPGRGVAVDRQLVVQIARPAAGLEHAVTELASRDRRPAGVAPPSPVRTLPTRLDHAELHRWAPAHRPDGDGDVALALGVSDVGLVVARLRLRPGGHALVAGPPGSGRTTALATLGHQAREAGLSVLHVRSTARPPCDTIGIDPDDPALARLAGAPGPLVVLVDDADLTAEDHPVLAELARDRRPDRHLVAGARSDRLRRGYGHWLRELRADRVGLLLDPDLDLDGELTGSILPRRTPIELGPGRGWLAGGDPEGFVQVATPPCHAQDSLDPG